MLRINRALGTTGHCRAEQRHAIPYRYDVYARLCFPERAEAAGALFAPAYNESRCLPSNVHGAATERTSHIDCYGQDSGS